MKIDSVEENIQFIKANYSESIRIDMIKRLIEVEEVWVGNKPEDTEMIPAKETVIRLHSLIDKIFNVVIKNLKWKESTSLESWDYRPMIVMEKSFPDIQNTQWYNIRHLQVLTKFGKQDEI